MNSMTGYGMGSFNSSNHSIKIEIKSVNNRYLDINVRTPRILISYDELIKKLIKEKISRGKVDIFINFNTLNSKNLNIDVDLDLAEKYYEISEKLSKRLSITNDFSIKNLLENEDIIRIEDEELGSDEIEDIILKATNEALENFIIMRENEGNKILSDFRIKLGRIKEIVDKINCLAPVSLKERENKLREKIETYLDEKIVDEKSFQTEIAIMMDKLAIDEEITRLYIHIDSFNDIMYTKEPMGRKLDFLLQEFNREVNTIGSKTDNIEILNLVVKLKSEIEKLREQVQNIE